MNLRDIRYGRFNSVLARRLLGLFYHAGGAYRIWFGPLRGTRYIRRWLVERFFAWIQWQRRILVRWEYHTQNFLGFVQLDTC